MAILPTRTELSKFVKEHPIVSVFGAFTLANASFTLLRAVTSPEGSSPYASSYTLGHITQKEQAEIDDVAKQLRAASKMHKGQAKRLTNLGASTSTTTSTSSSHGAMPKEAAPTLLEYSGGTPKMFGGQKKMLRVPGKLKRRVSHGGFGSVSNGFTGKQDIGSKFDTAPSPVSVHDIFGNVGLIPEVGEEMVVV